MKTLMIATCFAAISSTAHAAPVDLSDTYSSFIAFGDSLTDDGKFNDTDFQPGLPGLDGRFSNGRTFAEYIADDFGFSQNFAIGGATARTENENALLPPIGTFTGQVAAFTGLANDVLGRALIGDRPLFSVLFGANDILQNVGLPGDFDVEIGVGALAADAVEASIRAINAISGSFNDFVVMNLPDLSQTPLFQNSAFGAGALASFAQGETAGFNAQLSMNIDKLRDDGINIIELDLNDLFEQFSDQASLIGVDTLNPCSFDLSNLGPEDTCVFSADATDNTDLSLAEGFFFIDGIHPNGDVHAAFADEFRAAVTLAPVPLPAGLPLLLAGLGAFGLMRTRKAA